MTDNDNRTRKIMWVVVWIVISILVLVIAFPAGQTATYFGWWPANNLELAAVGFFAFLVYLAYMRDMMFNIHPIDDDDIQPISNDDIDPVEADDVDAAAGTETEEVSG